MRKVLATCGFSLMLGACGTGSAPPAQTRVDTSLLASSAGIFSGALSTRTPITLLSLDDGSAYLFYQKPVAGVIVVTNRPSTGNGSIPGKSGTQYSFAPSAAATPVQVRIDFSRSPDISGTIVSTESGATPMTFTAQAEASLGQGPGLGTIAGEYSGQISSLQGNGTVQILIARDGLLAGRTSAGCNFRGNVSPDSGVDAYKASFTFSTAPCAMPNATLSGHAVLRENRLLIALPKLDRSDIVVFDGTR